MRAIGQERKLSFVWEGHKYQRQIAFKNLKDEAKKIILHNNFNLYALPFALTQCCGSGKEFILVSIIF